MGNSTRGNDFAWLQDYAVFDHVPLTKYERLVGLAGLEVAINDCIEEARFRVDTIVAAAEIGKSEIIGRETRILKSLCETCGFVRLAELTRVVEDVAKVRSAHDTLLFVGELFRVLELSLAELQAFADDLGAQIRPHISRSR
ncbi:MAG: Hpt domain-containing protein [Alphaproteobacteria bacterium]|nr:Hpt domain-containing protein [Alphaproteobacteria bacterium]